MAAKKRQEYIEEHLTLEDVLAAGGLKPPVIPQLK